MDTVEHEMPVEIERFSLNSAGWILVLLAVMIHFPLVTVQVPSVVGGGTQFVLNAVLDLLVLMRVLIAFHRKNADAGWLFYLPLLATSVYWIWPLLKLMIRLLHG